MTNHKINNKNLINGLNERAKELNCLYRVNEILNNQRLSLPEIFNELVKVVPSGWQFSDSCKARIIYEDHSFQEDDFFSSSICQNSIIKVNGKKIGRIEIYYSNDVGSGKHGYFLEKEEQLINTIADRISQTISYRQMEEMFHDWNVSKQEQLNHNSNYGEWKIIVDLLQKTDKTMLLHLARKMLTFLSAKGVKEAKEVLWDFSSGTKKSYEVTEINYPTAKFPINDSKMISNKAFKIAANYLSDNEIALKLTKWLQEEKAYSLISTIDQPGTSVSEIINAITRYRTIYGDSSILYSPTENWLIVALMRVFLTDNLDFINKTRQFFDIKDFYYIIDRLIYPRESHGKIGGKAAGLFTAQKILNFLLLKYREHGI